MPNADDPTFSTTADEAPSIPDVPVIAAGRAEQTVAQAAREARDAVARLDAIAHAIARALDAGELGPR